MGLSQTPQENASLDRKIFVMGGGGFAMEPDNLLLDQYILSLADASKPKICYIGTASGDLIKFY